MSKDLHNEDEYFRKAYRQSEEEPSPDVWDKINARLDKADAIFYRSKFAVWKRIACVLLLLLSSVVIYQTFFAGKNAAMPNAVVQHKTLIPDSNTTSFNQPEEENSIAFYQKEKLSGTNGSFFINKQVNKTFSNIQESSQTLIPANSNDFIYQSQPDLVPGQSLITIQAETKDSLKIADILGELNDTYQSNNDPLYKLPVINQKNIQESTLKKPYPKSQNSKNFKPYFTLMPYASVDFTEYELDDDDHSPNNTTDDKQDIKGRETHQFSFSTGMLGKWQFSPKLSLKTGLVYSNIAIGIRPQTLYASAEDNQRNGFKFITSSGYAFVNPVFSASPAAGDSITAAVAQHHLQYLNVPLLIGYKMSAGNHFSITPGAGVSINTLLSTKVRTEVNEDTDTETVVINKLQGLKKTYYSFTVDAELNYMLNKHISITAFPVFKYALNSITKNNVVRTYPYSISLGAGISYSF